MADSRAAVTDTHPLVFHAGPRARLGPKARAFFDRCERQQAIIYVPAAVIWECGILVRVGHVTLTGSIREFFDNLFSNPAFQPLDATAEQALVASELGFTRDPFDALICAAARTLGAPLITRDAAINESGVLKTIW